MKDNSAGRPAIAIDPSRMKAVFDGINAFGRSFETGGFNRSGFSDADMAARRWLADFMVTEGLAVRWDGAGSVFGRLGETGAPVVMLGSHPDTVPEGGAFDGTLGVAAAVECALAIRDSGIALACPVEVVATAEEEGRFGGMLGSQAMVGLVTHDWLERAEDAGGIRLADAMQAQGLDPMDALLAARPPGSVKAFLELHVEQGPVLERAQLAVGVADRVSGLVSLAVTFTGVANHSGTTPMDMRADAFAGLAQAGAAIPDLIARYGTGQSRITIGQVDLHPNAQHTIPGRADFTVIVRDTDQSTIDQLMDGLHGILREAASAHGLGLTTVERSRLAPVELDAGLVALLGEEATGLGMDALVMVSGAGHDAQTMQTLWPSALIFVPSRSGVSHAPGEWTNWNDACAGTQVMLAAAVRLAGGLS